MDKLLMVDDDREVLAINKKYFVKKGYEVRTASNGKEGLRQLAGFGPDCVVLDVMMPGMGGMAFLEELRKTENVTVLFLTGKLDEKAKVQGLMLGADDYIAKPCSLIELEARVAANIRRHRAAAKPQLSNLSFPPLEIDIVAHQAFCDGESLGLSNREYDLLYFLATHVGELVTFEQIADQMWGYYQPEDRRVMMVSMSRLRKKMEKPIDISGMIETVWSKGYKFIDRAKR
jgi:DNA-binding response OmpR family regulator